MVQITLSNILPNVVPTNGWIVGYRIKGTTGNYIVATGSPFMSVPIVFNTTDPAGTLYEGYVQGDCGFSKSINLNWITPCDCVVDFAPNVNNTLCTKTTTIAATITNSGYCLAKTSNGAYSSYGSRIYNAGFSLDTIMLAPASVDTYIYGSMTNNPQWANPALDNASGPMNREAVWIDSNCDGNKDALSRGVSTTLAAMFNNTGGIRTIFVGIGADNQFKLVVNGSVVVDTGSTISSNQFKIWHIIPITLQAGVNYINIIATGDGTVNDAMAMVLYDNTAAQILAATSDSQLNIVYKSSAVAGTTYDIATCPAGYSLDNSGGSGNYTCVLVQTKVCNSAS